MKLRDRLAGLKDLVDPKTILMAFGACREDLELLYFVEKTLRKLNPPKAEK